MSTIDDNKKVYLEVVSGDEFETLQDCVNHVDNTRSTNQHLYFQEVIKITKA